MTAYANKGTSPICFNIKPKMYLGLLGMFLYASCGAMHHNSTSSKDCTITISCAISCLHTTSQICTSAEYVFGPVLERSGR